MSRTLFESKHLRIYAGRDYLFGKGNWCICILAFDRSEHAHLGEHNYRFVLAAGVRWWPRFIAPIWYCVLSPAWADEPTAVAEHHRTLAWLHKRTTR